MRENQGVALILLGRGSGSRLEQTIVNWMKVGRKKRIACCPEVRGGKSATACGINWLPGNCATGCCTISLGTFSPPFEQEPVSISGYVTRLTESLPKKLKGLLLSQEEIEAELSKT
jgi:hypothetical protein